MSSLKMAGKLWKIGTIFDIAIFIGKSHCTFKVLRVSEPQLNSTYIKKENTKTNFSCCQGNRLSSVSYLVKEYV